MPLKVTYEGLGEIELRDVDYGDVFLLNNKAYINFVSGVYNIETGGGILSVAGWTKNTIVRPIDVELVVRGAGKKTELPTEVNPFEADHERDKQSWCFDKERLESEIKHLGAALAKARRGTTSPHSGITDLIEEIDAANPANELRTLKLKAEHDDLIQQFSDLQGELAAVSEDLEDCESRENELIELQIQDKEMIDDLREEVTRLGDIADEAEVEAVSYRKSIASAKDAAGKMRKRYDLEVLAHAKTKEKWHNAVAKNKKS